MEMYGKKLRYIGEFLNIYKKPSLLLNKEFTIEYANKKAKKLFARSGEELIGKAYRDIPLDYTGTPGWKLYEDCQEIESGHCKTIEAYYRARDKWFEIDIYGLDGLIYLATFRDISEVIELREKEREYLEVLDSCSLGFYIRDYRKKELYLSKTWNERVKSKNIDPKQLFLNPYYLVHPEDAQKLNWLIEKTIGQGKEKFKAEVRVKLRGTSHTWLLVQAKLIYNEEGQPIKEFGTHMDITDRKLVEIALRKNEGKTKKLVKNLKKADELKNNFISTLGHELRNPLVTMSMAISLLDMVDPGSDVDKETREIIKRQTSQLIRLVDDILNTSRIISKKMKLIKKNLDINKLVKELMEEYKTLFDNKKIELKAKYYDEPIYIFADYVRIKQVIGNILSNALKFTERGGSVRIIVNRDENRGQALIKVIDTGIGIAPELLPELFGVFVQLNNSLTRSTSGLGLGLSIVKEIIDLHQGTVEAWSEGIGKGTKITISLPYIEDKHGNNR